MLWCYANAERLARRGIWVVCADEMPNLQVLERGPIRRAIPGSIEQQEFEYTRHGTVNLLLFLVVHTGRMEAVCLEAKDAEHYIQALERFRRRHRGLKGVFLIQDGGPSHTAGDDGGLLRRLPRLVAAPVDAGPRLVAEPGGVADPRLRLPLPEAGLVDEPGGVHRACVASWPEYNRRYAHPFEWTWTNQDGGNGSPRMPNEFLAVLAARDTRPTILN